MTDLELPDLGHDLIGIDLEKGIYKVRGLDNESSDSGNNSMNTNGSGWFGSWVRSTVLKSSSFFLLALILIALSFHNQKLCHRLILCKPTTNRFWATGALLTKRPPQLHWNVYAPLMIATIWQNAEWGESVDWSVGVCYFLSYHDTSM